MSKVIQETDLYGCMSDSSGGRSVRHCLEEIPGAHFVMCHAACLDRDGTSDLDAVRGQYGRGIVGGKKFQGIVNQGLLQLSKAIGPFRFESLRPLTAGTDRQSNSTVETYAAIKLRIDNWRWIGVPSASTCRPASPRNASALIVCDTRPLTFFMRNHPLRRSPPLH
jgi:hypothetical protein